MKDKRFDQLIKERMERLEVPIQSGGWEAFSSKLDQHTMTGIPEQEDRDFDELIFQQLHRLEAAFNPKHWSKMRRRMRTELGWHRTLVSLKLAELALVALLVFVFGHEFANPNRLPGKHKLPPSPDRVVAGSATVPSSTASALPSPEVWSARDAVQPPVPSDNPIFSATAGSPLLQMGTTTIPTLSASPVKGSASQITTSPKRVATSAPDVPNATGPSLLQNTTPPVRYTPYVDLDPVISLPQKETLLRIGMTGGVDYNRVITPPDPKENRLEVYDRYAMGYSSGVSVGFEMGKLEIETGLGYASRHYLPQPVVFVQGSLQEGFIGEGIREIELNMLSLPLNLKLHFLNREKWRIYVIAGTTLHFAFHNNYYTSAQSFSSGLTRPLLNAGPISPLEDNKELKAGFFEGGPFTENSYLTGNLGLGLERNFSYRWSLFVQPTYQHATNSFGLLDKRLGPNKDEIRTFSVFTGIKMRLFK